MWTRASIRIFTMSWTWGSFGLCVLLAHAGFPWAVHLLTGFALSDGILLWLFANMRWYEVILFVIPFYAAALVAFPSFAMR